MGNPNFDFFLDEMLDSAVQSFRETGQYALLREKREQMDRDCEVNLTEDGREFASGCFDLLLDIQGQQERYVYFRGMRDCVRILRKLGVLA